MTKRFLMILVFGLLWSTASFAETRLQCKYWDSIRYIHSESSTLSSEIKNAPKSITISLDIKNKKIIYAWGDYFRGSETKWSEGKIVWFNRKKIGNGKGATVSGVLDRYTGYYHYEKKIINIENRFEVLDEVLITWKCEAKQKKF